MRRLIMPVLTLVLLLAAAPVAPAQARPVGAESVRVIVRTDRMRAGVEHGVAMWAGAKPLVKRCLPIGQQCFQLINVVCRTLCRNESEMVIQNSQSIGDFLGCLGLKNDIAFRKGTKQILI